jgi:hypothetical protein
MNNNERLEIIWSAINCMVAPSEIMHAIEQVTGKKRLTARWSKYFDAPEGTEAAIKQDLKAMKPARRKAAKK